MKYHNPSVYDMPNSMATKLTDNDVCIMGEREVYDFEEGGEDEIIL